MTFVLTAIRYLTTFVYQASLVAASFTAAFGQFRCQNASGLSALSAIAAFVGVRLVLSCDGCYGPQKDVVLTRNVRRMQPESSSAITQPRAPLEWGQINFLHETDTHGWLEGHLKEQNYGADWGDFVSFSRHMKRKARSLGLDLLLIDTGDLHDGSGLSDATPLNENVTNLIFENVDYDLLTIGNHELYVSEISYETFYQFSTVYGDKYLTSNVEIINSVTRQFEYIGSKYRYFTTHYGLRIMAFGVLFDFAGNSNVSRVTKTADLVKQQWFRDAVNYTKPIDLFIVIGHNAIRPSARSSTFGTLYNVIRGLRPDIPIQAFGGHTHVRDFFVYDNKTTGLESGRYCETLGWLSMSGIKPPTFRGRQMHSGVPNPTRNAVPVGSGTPASSVPTPARSSGLVYAHRYLDWNRLTFTYHTAPDVPFDFHSGLLVTSEITEARKKLALATTVVNESRKDIPRLILSNIGTIRFDLPKGPFTLDDSYIVSPFKDAFQFIPNVSYIIAKQVLGILNAGPLQKREINQDFGFGQMAPQDPCVDPPVSHEHATGKSYAGSRLLRRQNVQLFPGYTTIDDFGTDGDDTPHTKIPYYNQPNDVQANASFPADGSDPETVDLVFVDFIASWVLGALNGIGANYTMGDVLYYLPTDFTTNSYLPAYAKVAWQANMPNCPVGVGIGS